MARAQTTKEYIAKLNKRIKELTSDKFLRECILGTHTLQVNRIFNKGQQASGAPIGQYSKAYAAFRRKKGRTTGKVVLQLTGQLISDYGSSLTRVKEGVYNVGAKRGFNADKLDSIIERYGGGVFTLSKSERKRLNFCITKKRLKLGV